ncbi:MAG: YbaB/EbfC family nucleoid-associated protein [Candidatus Gastranaerophilales bacterium]|nr:YbaB/EbfC family nucleoid-associated protein [Candidatus Gastranaerophilales bacterium]
MKGYDFQKMLKQAQQMQKKMESTQDELANIEMTGISGGGVVEVKFNCKNEFISIKFKPEAINPDNPESVDVETIEMLEDLVSSAIKDATTKVNNTVQEKMSSVTGGMNLNIPGMF